MCLYLIPCPQDVSPSSHYVICPLIFLLRVWFWQICGFSEYGIFKYMANVNFHVCLLICWIFIMGLKDRQNCRGHEFCAEGRERERERTDRWGEKEKKKGTIIYFWLKFKQGFTLESQKSNWWPVTLKLLWKIYSTYSLVSCDLF